MGEESVECRRSKEFNKEVRKTYGGGDGKGVGKRGEVRKGYRPVDAEVPEAKRQRYTIEKGYWE